MIRYSSGARLATGILWFFNFFMTLTTNSLFEEEGYR